MIDNTASVNEAFNVAHHKALHYRHEFIMPEHLLAAFLEQDMEGANDAFHQFVLDAVYDKEHTHSGEAPYRIPVIDEQNRIGTFR